MNYFSNSPLVTTDFIFDGGILFSLGLYLCTETHYTGISPLKYILIDDQLSHLWVMEPFQLGFLVCLKDRKKKTLSLITTLIFTMVFRAHLLGLLFQN